MPMSPTDRDLGMSRPITRRDFVHDLSLAGLGLALPLPGLAFSPGVEAPYYPPTLTGLRGSHAGAFEVAHALAREGKLFENPQALDEAYNLIVVGGGISGLAAAYYYRKLHGPVADPDPRQPRRLRRPRQAQRVPPGRADEHSPGAAPSTWSTRSTAKSRSASSASSASTSRACARTTTSTGWARMAG